MKIRNYRPEIRAVLSALIARLTKQGKRKHK